MSTSFIIFCPGGANSQTGTAVSERYNSVEIKECGENVAAAADHLKRGGKGPYVVPIWNSHQGEIATANYVWDYIQKTIIKLSDFWPKGIDFWYIKRSDVQSSTKKIGSVGVAKTQCSKFLQQQKATLISCPLTTVAHDEFRQGVPWDGVLVAPGQGEGEPGFEVAAKKTANPNNFTSFVRFHPTINFNLKALSVNAWLTGVTMPAFGITLGDTEQSFFQKLLSEVEDVNNIPKLIFVLKRTAKVGLLFEGTRFYSGDLLDVEEKETGNVSIYEEVGALENPYTNELNLLFDSEFSNLKSADFILHRGVGTCLFGCPPLGLYTHGYEVETVEPVVRFYISELFQRLEDGANCSSAQRDFFNRHRTAWQKDRSSFIKFKEIKPT